MVEEAWALYMTLERLYLAAPRFSPEERRLSRLTNRARLRWLRRLGRRAAAYWARP